jgi:hypothetical protein
MYDDAPPSPVVTGRSIALTMPEVTVLLSPSGEPIATTVSPTCILREDPIAAARRPCPADTSSTAMSYTGLRPTIFAACLAPFWSTTLISPLPVASATTWLLVITWFLSSSTNPDPVAPPSVLLSAPPLAWIWTVLGSSFAATALTLPLSAASGAAAPLSVPITGMLLTAPGFIEVDTATPPMTPPRAPTTSAMQVITGQAQPGR